MATVKGSETIMVRPYVGKDWEGDAEYGTPYYIPRCLVIPRYIRETDTTPAGYDVWAPPRGLLPRVQENDRVVCRDEEWDVNGVPGLWRGKNGVERGNKITLERVT